MTTSPNGRMAATVLLPLETSMPTEFMYLPPIQICNRNPSFSRCRFNLLGDANSMAQPAQIERYNKRMANSLSCGHESPRRMWLASCSSYCSLGTRWKGSRTGCPASLSKYIVIGGENNDRHYIHTKMKESSQVSYNGEIPCIPGNVLPLLVYVFSHKSQHFFADRKC